MSQLAQLLLAKEPLLDQSLRELEAITGQKGIDAKLTAEIMEKSADRLKRLGLDTNTSGPTIYEALLKQVAQHDQHLAVAIGGHNATSIPEMIPLIVEKVQSLDLPKHGFFLKEAVARQMLRRQPPTKIMERLGYQEVDDLLERESIYELCLSLRFGEEPDWLNQFDAGYKTLKSSDFEERDLHLMIFDSCLCWFTIIMRFISIAHSLS
jgi:hypothetical protein